MTRAILHTNASIRRFARLIFNKSEHKKKEILQGLSPDSRIKVEEEIERLKEEKNVSSKK